jgi:hypothetical protein
MGPVSRRVAESRRSLLEELDRVEAQGTTRRVSWLTARDPYTCPQCQEREGKVFTIEEARRILKGAFCTGDDEAPNDRCRCTFLYA